MHTHLHMGSMTLMVIEGISYDITSNPTWTISSFVVSPTSRDITYKLCMYYIATWFNKMAVSWAAIVIEFDWAPCRNIIVNLTIHTPVKDYHYRKHPASVSVLGDHCVGIQLGLNPHTDSIKTIYYQYRLLGGLSVGITHNATIMYHLAHCSGSSTWSTKI